MVAPFRPSSRSAAESRLIDSWFAQGSHLRGAEHVRDWLSGMSRHAWMETTRAGLDELPGWTRDPGTGFLRHHTGRFFGVEAVTVDHVGAAVPHWQQPIINQPEIGILGILVREIDGVLHCLIQAKQEPGNPGGGLQLSPTVQATRSNYTGVHKGRAIPYLEYFREPLGRRVLVDIRQSEQGAWFYRKRNRNMVVEAGDDVEAIDGFGWLTLRQLAELLSVPDLVNMDTRTVLACLPGGGAYWADAVAANGGFLTALARSADPAAPSVHTTDEVLSWITEARTRTELRVEKRALRGLEGWQERNGVISHHSGRFFSVVGVHVSAGGREVGAWSQPMIEPAGTGVIAFLVREIDGVLHVLTHARTEPGYADVVELAPTVQCAPENYAVLPDSARPRFLAEVLRSDRVRFDTVLSEEGGRFLGAQNRYLIVESDVDVARDDPEYRWLTLAQYDELLRHSFYVNIQARSLVLCLRSLAVV
ncbi:NDP-hexose 2,3-dehydratase family protein [Saccharomonospora xinjiangensis]|uniref:NDP-hexose 2,3-dehydratase family protein n=1 Tax=Saccharomonospora xinjiangensis TaxID=75294 RepID=UPI00107027E6|nr:NDP-hexose 2,3-dehydratase family protein [Saccharomonospora xinjiangensis]QBQ61645.1 NDP-hexose 2,3-dehydratase [Saccharomonospora xinjiangensis]